MGLIDYSDLMITTLDWWIILSSGVAFYIVMYVFESIALFKIAGNNGYKNRWMAFIPFLNTYFIGVCAQKNKFYSLNAKTLGIISALLEVVVTAFSILHLVALAFLVDYIIPVEGTFFRFTIDSVPESLNWAVVVIDYVSVVSNVFQLLYTVAKIALLICFFQTYASNRYALFTITSIFFSPLQGIFFFVVRNNRAINYRDFVMAQQARQYAEYQRQQQYYNQNPYNRNPYNRNPNHGQNPYNQPPTNGGAAPEDPFGDLGGKPEDPFDDFGSN